jgi:signal transduction histidine kinase
MSIRLKLLITYVLCVLLSAGVLALSIFAGVGRFAKQISDIVLDESTPDQVFVEVMDVMAEIKHAEKYEPETLIDVEFIEAIDKRLSAISSSLVVVYKDDWIVVDDYPEDLLRRNLYPSDNHEEGFVMNGYHYVFTNFTFTLDQEPVFYYVLMDVTEVVDFNAEVRRGIGVAILLLIVLMTLPLILLTQKSIIKPLKELDKGAQEIGQGNLEFKLYSKSNDEMGKVIRSYERMRQELKASIDRQVQYENNRKELISSISHDLKTPMTSIKGYVEGILDGVANTPEKQERYLKVIHQKSLDMDRMIDDLFTFSKLDLKKLPFEFTYINMERFIRDYVQEAAIEYSEVGKVELTYTNNSATSPVANIDALQIRRVLQNLVQNSFYYNDSAQKKVEIILENNDDTISIAVKDNGIGMVEEELKQVFTIFYRTDMSRNTKTGGSGLGLAIVKQIIDGHHGKIKAASSKGRGTKITMIFNKEKTDGDRK